MHIVGADQSGSRGRESQDQHGESLAQLTADKMRLGSSLMFQARRHDRPMPFAPPSWARNFSEEDLKLRPHASTTGDHGDLNLEYGYWWIEWGGHLDTHPALGVDAHDEPPCTQHQVPFLYDIPLRACISSTIKNLMFAGRNISATHIAFASTRVMATCTEMGQGVGTAAAYAVANNLQPWELAETPTAVAAIQQQLLKDDAFLIGIANQDPQDLARSATVTASSQQPQGKAANATCGQTVPCRFSQGSLHTRPPQPPPGRRHQNISWSWVSPQIQATQTTVPSPNLHRQKTNGTALDGQASC
jgi:FAD-dependent oxidoreductase family protein